MDIYTVKPISQGIDYGVSGIEEVLQNVSCLLATYIYDCPLDRELGWMPALDIPIDQAEAENVENILNAIDLYEPRAVVTEIIVATDQLSGKLEIHVKVGVDLDGNNDTEV